MQAVTLCEYNLGVACCMLLTKHTSCRSITQSLTPDLIRNDKAALQATIESIQAEAYRVLPDVQLSQEQKKQFLTFVEQGPAGWMCTDQVRMKNCEVNLLARVVVIIQKIRKGNYILQLNARKIVNLENSAVLSMFARRQISKQSIFSLAFI